VCSSDLSPRAIKFLTFEIFLKYRRIQSNFYFDIMIRDF